MVSKTVLLGSSPSAPAKQMQLPKGWLFLFAGTKRDSKPREENAVVSAFLAAGEHCRKAVRRVLVPLPNRKATQEGGFLFHA